jgi:hypothetical protein
MSKINHFVSKFRSYIVVFFIYNYFWYILPTQTVIVNTEGWFEKAFVAITAVPGMVFMLYHYFFRFYFAVFFGVYLIGVSILRKEKRTQHIICLVFIIIYMILYFFAIRIDFSEFPFPRVT